MVEYTGVPILTGHKPEAPAKQRPDSTTHASIAGNGGLTTAARWSTFRQKGSIAYRRRISPPRDGAVTMSPGFLGGKPWSPYGYEVISMAANNEGQPNGSPRWLGRIMVVLCLIGLAAAAVY